MRITFATLRILAVVAPLAGSIACSGNMSPTAPSTESHAAVESPAAVSSGATIVGTVTGELTAMQSVRRSVDLHGLIVTVDGTYVSAAVAEDGTFALFDVPARDVVLDFSAPNMSVSIPIGALERRDLVQVGVTLGDGTVTLDHLAFMSPNAAR